MLRGLYHVLRISTWFSLFMLLFATFRVIRLLTVLLQSLFKDQYNTPNSTARQLGTGAGVRDGVIVTAALFGGLHYWLLTTRYEGRPGRK